MPNRMKLDRETLGGLAEMFGQMPGAWLPLMFVVKVIVGFLSSDPFTLACFRSNIPGFPAPYLLTLTDHCQYGCIVNESGNTESHVKNYIRLM